MAIFKVLTEHPVAVDSLDHQHPCGAMRDNHKHDGFVRKIDDFFPNATAIMDIGCAGGGMVKQFVDIGWDAIGIEGSDYCKRRGLFEWATIPGNLFTADATKPFIAQCDGVPIEFDVITSWEVLEHIAEEDLFTFFLNIWTHLTDGGVFIGSICSTPWWWEGVDLHVTQRPPQWWDERIESFGFRRDTELEDYLGEDWVRRSDAQRCYRKVANDV